MSIQNRLRVLRNEKIKDTERPIYCIEENHIYTNADELQKLWSIKGKSIIIDVCNKKVKKQKRNGVSYEYVQETLKDRRDGKKKHIIWEENRSI